MYSCSTYSLSLLNSLSTQSILQKRKKEKKEGRKNGKEGRSSNDYYDQMMDRDKCCQWLLARQQTCNYVTQICSPPCSSLSLPKSFCCSYFLREKRRLLSPIPEFSSLFHFILFFVNRVKLGEREPGMIQMKSFLLAHTHTLHTVHKSNIGTSN